MTSVELQINGENAVDFIKKAYDLDQGTGMGRFDVHDPTQTALRMVKGWIVMAESDAAYETKVRRDGQ